MKKTFFTVGPTEAHPKLGEFIQNALEENIPSISHRGEDFQSVSRNTKDVLKSLFALPETTHIFFLSSATEAMERIVQNCVEKTSFHLVNGAFSKRFHSTALELKKEPKKIEVPAGEGFTLEAVNIPPESELVCITENETGTGAELSVDSIHAFRKKNPDPLFAVDITSSAPYPSVNYSLVDCAFFSVQKGFGMPAGLGVLFVNERCIEKAKNLQEQGVNIGTYHNFSSLLKFAEKEQTPETPNVLAIYLLGRIARTYREYGVERIRKETEEKAKLLYEFFEKREGLAPFVKKSEWRSKTTLSIETADGSRSLREILKSKGLIVDGGYGKYKETQIRIANFPTHSIDDVKRLLKALE